MKEEWKDIPDYEGIYQVSNLGKIRNKKGNRKLTLRKDGYLHIPLTKSGKTKYYLVHRLVAQAFISNENNYKEINHKDENKINNCADNLEWCNRSYNINYGTANLKRAKTHYVKINQYTKNGDFIKQWNCISEASRVLKIKMPHIIRVCRGGRKTTGNYIFRYVKEENI